jgi:hypothetical protein
VIKVKQVIQEQLVCWESIKLQKMTP